MMITEDFLELSEDYNLIPIYKQIIADTETPVSIYNKLAHNRDYSFLLESASIEKTTGDDRYSFIGITPKMIIQNTSAGLIITNENNKPKIRNTDLIDYLQTYLEQLKVYEREDLPYFTGGFVGYFGYEIIDEWENLYHDQPEKNLQKGKLPSSTLVKAELLVVYDHLDNTVKVIDNIHLEPDLDRHEKIRLFRQSRQKINNIISKIREPNSIPAGTDENYNGKEIGQLKSPTTRKEFAKMVMKAKKLIKNGDIFQVVLSREFTLPTELSPFQVYRALRVSNPSPYLFYLNFPEVKVIGSSPEILVQVKGNKVINRPLAGTRPRGNNQKEDDKFKQELLDNEKERAEHIMLVDLGRNDLGRVCQYSSVEVTELMGIEYFTRVMHLVSQVEGTKKPEVSSLEVLKAVFPAGTVAGAPKIRAMEIINDLENRPRGIYAGAVGYLDFRGNLDTCITIRTFSYRNGQLSVRAGAGIVADSVPEREYEETYNKARALFEALEIIKKEGLYGTGY